MIDARKSSVEGKVIFGAYVTLYDLNSEQEVTYQIVGDLEADLENGKITVSSPLARALIGKEIDDEVTFKAPAGIKEFEIVDVKYV